MKILIAGAGIGGLTAAAYLIRAGHEVEVYEQAPSLKEVGAGIQLPANAMHILRDLGLEETLLSVGVRPKMYQFRLYDSGELLHAFPLFEEHARQHGAPFVQVHRADLQMVLSDLVDSLQRGTVHLGKKVIGFSERADAVSLAFADGSYAEGDLLVGADGVKSAVSTQLIGGFRSRYSGITSWRFLVPRARVQKDLRLDEVTSIFIGTGQIAVAYYLRNGSLINFTGQVILPEPIDETWTRKAPWAGLSADFEGWHPGIRALIDAAPRDEIYRWSLFAREPATNWSTGRATLLGDAAHPALPFLAQGAGMAMEDAVILSRALQATKDLAGALQIYQRTRMPRTTHATTRTEANRRTYELKTKEEIRRAYAGLNEGSDRSAWLYSYNALTAPLA